MNWTKEDQFDILDYAKYIINHQIDNHKPITNVQLNIALYYIVKYFLQYENIYIFDEIITACKWGPRFDRLYYNYCTNGAFPILMKEDENPKFKLDNNKYYVINSIVNEIISSYPGKYSEPKALVAVANNKGYGYYIFKKDIEWEITHMDPRENPLYKFSRVY